MRRVRSAGFVARSQLLLGLSGGGAAAAAGSAELRPRCRRARSRSSSSGGSSSASSQAPTSPSGSPRRAARPPARLRQCRSAYGGRCLAGLVEEAIDAEAKARYLRGLGGLRELHAALALGDGANDIHMLSTAGHALPATAV